MKIQKKIIALAIASALTAPALAFADSANANFYGVLCADVENVTVGTAATATGDTSRGRLTSNASRIGLNGSEDLGNGLTAIYQIETRVNLVGNETSAAAVAGATGSGTTAGIFDGIRNSNLGLKGAFGTVFVGQWDTPYKVSHNKVELFDNTNIATALALLGSVNGGGAKENLFNVRAGSSVQYWTPDMNGFKVMGAYGFQNANPDTGNVNGTPSVISLSGTYDMGPIYVAAAYEAHKSTGALTATGLEATDKGERLVAAYTVDAFQVGLTWEKITLAANSTVAGVGLLTADQSRNAYSLEGKYNIPNAGTIAATYTKAGDQGGVADTGATQISLRYGYMLSKRTELFGMYTDIKNDAAASYNFADVVQPAAATGSGVKGYGVGVRFTF
jgi:predicted porin